MSDIWYAYMEKFKSVDEMLESKVRKPRFRGFYFTGTSIHQPEVDVLRSCIEMPNLRMHLVQTSSDEI